MKVCFMLLSKNQRPYQEEEISALSSEEITQLFPKDTTLYGELYIADEQQDETATIHDDFSFLMPGLCLEAAMTLAQNQPYSYALASEDQLVSFTLKDNHIIIEGDNIGLGDYIFPQRETLLALLDCGARYIALEEKRLGEKDPRIASLKETLKKAHALLP